MWLLKGFLCLCFIKFYSEASTLSRYETEEYIENPQERQCHPDYGLNIFGFLKKYHYPIKKHTVTTEDGYILDLHRIPHGRHGNKTSQFQIRPPVLLLHGLGTSGMDFVIKGPTSSIGLLLADAGWDVWLGNNRGTTWSRKHVSLDPDKDEEYWDFSFHECGYYDLPAMIDYILSVTHTKKLFFIGQSQGNTQFFSLAASRPEYNEKIELMVALAPAAYLRHLSSKLFRYLANNLPFVQLVLNGLGITHVSRSDLITDMGKIVCCDGSIYKQFCIDLYYMLGGNNPAQIDKDVEKLALDLPNVVRKYKVPDRLFTHLDFIWAKNLSVLNDAVVEHMNIHMESVLFNSTKL